MAPFNLLKDFMENKRSNYTVSKFILRSDIIIAEQSVMLYDLEAVGGVASLFVNPNAAVEEITIEGVPPCDGAISVIGDSMSPLIMAGDTILYKTVPNRRGGLFFGNIYLLAFTVDGDEYISVKYVYQSDIPGCYRLESLNPAHKPKDIPVDCVREMAIVKACIRTI